MNALLASIFSPLKETASSRNGQALDRLEGFATPTKKRGPPKRTARKSVSFDMTPKAQVKHTPPKSGPAPRESDEPTNGWDLIDEPGREVSHADELAAEVTEPTVPVDEPSATTEPADKATDAGPDTVDPASDEFAFKELTGHRWDGDSIQIQVKWENGQRTWEPETMLHDDAPQALLDYWRRQPGGRPDNPRQPGLYEIHAIRKHSRDRKRLFVEWVGFGPNESTWEPRKAVADAAPEILSDYFDSLPRTKRRRVR
ncbi:Chromo domain [Cordyceps militaris CM01]|uniref:Chromo domain n=1 Tax=Cordyceps militaris (strain CM01) TaxID=983644 RepID=G3JH44_CORMM|nr:Chromo domain [Cordyceps militaris CM01]EGX91600.1 Chromo domain [Cordyceps militaris CM01]